MVCIKQLMLVFQDSNNSQRKDLRLMGTNARVSGYAYFACRYPCAFISGSGAGIPKRYKISAVWGKKGWFGRGILAGVSKTTLLSWYEVKGCIFFLFCDVFRRIATQKQLFLVGLRDSVALGMEVFCVHATFLDFGDNLRCMKQVASSLVRQGISQSVASQAAPCNLAGKACSVTGFAKI